MFKDFFTVCKKEIRSMTIKFNQYIKDCEAGAGRTPLVRMRK